MKQLSIFAGYIFTMATDGNITVTNTETNAVSAPNKNGEFKIKGADGTPVKVTVDELKAHTEWAEVASDTTAAEPAKPAVTVESLQAAIDTATTANQTAQDALKAATDANTAAPTDATVAALTTATGVATEAAEALKTAQDALKTFNRNIKIAAIKESVKATAAANAASQQPLLDAVNASKKNMQDAMMDDNVSLETLAALRAALRAANTAYEAFVPAVDSNIAEIDSNIDDLTDQIETLQDELKEYKKLKAGATGKKASESTASGERSEYPDFTWEMGEKCRTMKAEGKTAEETMNAVNCSYGSYQRSIGKAKDGFKPYHPVYTNKPTQVEIPGKKA